MKERYFESANEPSVDGAAAATGRVFAVGACGSSK